LLRIAARVFESEVRDLASAADWDPYFWKALQCATPEEWEATRRSEAATGVRGVQDLESAVPDFFNKVQRVKRLLQEETGRDFNVGVLDFGEPYWFDMGSHFAIQGVFADIFSPSNRGRIVRSLLGLPDNIAYGESFIRKSRVAAGAKVSNSVILGSEIRDPRSAIEGAIIVNSRFGRLEVSRGGSAVHSRGEEVKIDAPHGMAFRLAGSHTLTGQECAASLVTGDGIQTLRYNYLLGSVVGANYGETVLDNPMSFAEAAEVMEAADPVWLDEWWAKAEPR
jgi:hypothetical protein